MKKLKSSGFTLTELMIVVVIIGILAAIAYPTYVDQARRGRRSDGQGVLAQLSQYMERFYTENNRYDKDSNGNDVVLPFNQSPIDGATKFYDLTVAAGLDDYTLSATPIAGGAQDGDPCGVMTLTNTGVRTPANCW